AVLPADLGDLGGRGVLASQRRRRIGRHQPDQHEGQNQQAGEGGNHQEQAAHDEGQHGSPCSPSRGDPALIIATGVASGATTTVPWRQPIGIRYSSCTQRISPPEPTGEKRKPLTRSVTPRISTVL